MKTEDRKTEEFSKEIQQLREKIDSLDSQLVELFGKRFEVVKEVGRLKKEYKTPPLNKERWNEVLEHVVKKGRKNNLSENFVKDVWERIHKEALELEK